MDYSTNQSGSLNISLMWRVQDWKLSYKPEEPALKLDLLLSFPDFPEREKRSATQIISKKVFKMHSPELYIETTFRSMLWQLLKNLTSSPELKFW